MRATGLESSIHYTYRREVYASGQEVFMTQRVARPMKFAAFISIIISVAVMLAACQGAVGKAGDGGATGSDRTDWPSGARRHAKHAAGTQGRQDAGHTTSRLGESHGHYRDQENKRDSDLEHILKIRKVSRASPIPWRNCRPTTRRSPTSFSLPSGLPSPATRASDTPADVVHLKDGANWFGFLGYRSFDSRHGDA